MSVRRAQHSGVPDVRASLESVRVSAVLRESLVSPFKIVLTFSPDNDKFSYKVRYNLSLNSAEAPKAGDVGQIVVI